MTLLRRVIGRVLRRARLARGKTLRDVAEAARVSVQYLSEVERGTKEASSEVLAAICAAHGWTLLDLLDEVRAELREPVTAGADTRAVTVPRSIAQRSVGSRSMATRPVAPVTIAPSVPARRGDVRLAA